MRLGMIGLGRMGANMTRRLLKAGVEVVVSDRGAEAVAQLASEGAEGASSVQDLVARLQAPRAVWMMIPAAGTDSLVEQLAGLLEPGDVIVDGGNGHFEQDIRRAASLSEKGIRYVDVGVSGGVWGLERGYSMMIGGDDEAVALLDPVFRALAPGVESAPRTPGREGEPTPAEQGYHHFGSAGAGHFVKMVHNGVEYGLMAAFAEGFNVLAAAGAGARPPEADAEVAPLERPERYRYDIDVSSAAEVWRRGSVVASWLLDLSAAALAGNPSLQGFAGRVSDSGEGRWTVHAAVDTGVPVPVISAALFERFTSRGAGDFGDRLLSAMRSEFGGHHERAAGS